MSEDKKLPKAKFRAGALASSVWENSGEKDGEKFTFDTIQLQRSYKDKDDKWVNESINLRKNDVANAMLVLSKAHEEIVLAKDEEETKED